MKTKYFILAALFLLLTISCHQKQDDLKGDWYFDKVILSFQDSFCMHPSYNGEYYKYEIHKDTLIINYKDNSKDTMDRFEYFIASISDTALNLKGIKPAIDYVDDKGDIVTDKEYIYKKIKTKNSKKIKKISYTCLMCFGRCPALSIEITNDLKVKFEGKNYTKLLGYYEGQISKDIFKLIENRFNYLEIDSIKKYYSSDITDQSTQTLVVHYDNKKIETLVYGVDQEPLELDLLLNMLQIIYLKINLVKSDIKNFNFESEQVRLKLDVSPPNENVFLLLDEK